MNGLVTLTTKWINVAHDIEAMEIPAGTAAALKAGTQVQLVHKLGGDFTVRGRRGGMFRVEGKNAKALGFEVPTLAAHESQATEFSDEAVHDQLRQVFDPEIPVNVLDLGLIYKVLTQPLGDGEYRLDITMTLTNPGCGMGQVLVDDVKRKVETVPGVKEAQVKLVFTPPWSPELMTEAARLEAGLW